MTMMFMEWQASLVDFKINTRQNSNGNEIEYFLLRKLKELSKKLYSKYKKEYFEMEMLFYLYSDFQNHSL